MPTLKRALSTIVQPGLVATFPQLQFVPAHVSATQSDAQKLQDFIFSKKRLMVCTGAGISTESGIPDYRGEGVGLYATSKKKPMQYQDFIGSESFRRRYWARNFVGWPNFSAVQPNMTHRYLANLESTFGSSLLHWLITQNVDGLHIKCGSRRVTELHGTAFQVICLKCENMITRKSYQTELENLNPDFHATVSASEIRPDADVSLREDQEKEFKVAPCSKCGGIIKPFIVYFGENVPKRRVEFLMRKVEESDGLLVLGSSLQVYSGYRFAVRAAEQQKPICIVNIGPTRGDHLATLRIDKVRCADLLSQICVPALG